MGWQDAPVISDQGWQSAPLVNAPPSGPQPSTMQTLIASPYGRGWHDNVLKPLEGAASLVGQGLPFVGGNPLLMAGIKSATGAIEKPYGEALAAQRNTPGYAAARAKADAMTAQRGSGFMDQMTGGFNPALAGTAAGLTDRSMDSANAAADSRTDAQTAYQKAHPALSFGAGALGGLLMAPEGTGQKLISQLNPSTQDQAISQVQKLMASSKAAPDAAGLKSAAGAAGGKPITSAEAIGKPAEVYLGALARREGGTADALAGEMAGRKADAPARMLGDYAQASGIDPAAAQGNLDQFVEANQGKASPLYKDAYAANQNVSSPAIDRILATPAGRKALNSASQMMQNDQSLMAVANPDLLEQAREAGQEIPWKGGVADGLKLRSLDYVKRALDDQISAAYRSGAKTEGGILTGLKNRLVTELDSADVTAAAGPNSLKSEGGLYAQARSAAGDYLGAKEEFTNGQNFILNPKVSAKEMTDHLSGLGSSDAQAFKGGIANRLFQLSQNGQLKTTIFNAPSVQQKLSAVLGADNASNFLGHMATENNMANFARTRVPGAGSPTAEYQAAMADQDANSSIPQSVVDFAVNAAKHGPINATLGAVADKAKDAAAAWMTRGMPIPTRDAVGQLLMMHPNDLADLLGAHPAIPAMGRVAPLRLPSLPANGQLPYGLIGSSLYAGQQRQ